MYAALLDACVLVPNALCDTILRLAERNFFRPLWSQRILDEARHAIEVVHPELTADQLHHRFEQMRATFDDATIVGWEALCAGLDLPDDNDRHVLAAAIAGNAQAIVTFNVKDFPAVALDPTSIQVCHPDEFLLDQLDLYPGLAVKVLREQAAALNHPPMDLPDVLNALAACGVPRFADAVRLIVADDS